MRPMTLAEPGVGVPSVSLAGLPSYKWYAQ